MLLLSLTTSADVARVFIGIWASRFGVTADVSSDRVPQFTSEHWNIVAGPLAMYKGSPSTGKRFHRSIKAHFGTASGTAAGSTGSHGSCWAQHPKVDLQASSAELVYGHLLQVPKDFIVCCVESAGHTRVLMPVPTSQHELLQTHIPNNLQLAGYVFIWKDANWASLPWRQGKNLHSGHE